jgi:hypothetical protein
MQIATGSGELEVTWTSGKRRMRFPHLRIPVGPAQAIIYPARTLAEVKETLRTHAALDPDAAADALWAERPPSLRRHA